MAHDHDLVREGLQRIIDARGNMAVVGVAADSAETLVLMGRLHPDVLVVDIRILNAGGTEVARRTREISSGTRTLAVSAYDDDEYVQAAKDAGAVGCVLTTAAGSELVNAVERIADGESVARPAVVGGAVRFWTRRWVGEQEPAGRLTSRELGVLSLAAKGLRSSAIAEELGISVRTVETHCRNVFRKLHVSSRVEAMLFAVSHDLVAEAAEVVGPGRRRVVPDPPRGSMRATADHGTTVSQ